MTISRNFMVLSVLATCILPLQAAELGDKAATLSIAEWVKGGPVDVTVADGKSVFVVEFWATWCAPCRTSIPHLTELQKKYKDKNVTFIGISDENAAKVKPFVTQQGDKMDYVVAIDKNRATHSAYMKAFGKNTIPTAFIIDQQGRIVWVGHPSGELDRVLEEVVAGKYDLEKARQRTTLLKYANEYLQAASRNGDQKRLGQLSEQILAIGAADSELLSQIAWAALMDPRIVVHDKAFALKAAELANKTSDGKDAGALETYAMALYENGKKDEAINALTRAIEIAKENAMPQKAVDQLVKRLEQYKNK